MLGAVPWSTQSPPTGNSVIVHAGRDVVLGRFRCLPDDPLWRAENVVAQGALVVFPGTCVEISRGRERIVADRNQVVLYADGETYRRRLVHPAGDHCVFVRLSPRLVAELDGSGFPDAGWAARANADSTYARLRLLVAEVELATGRALDADAIEEELLGVVASACAPSAATSSEPTDAWRRLADSVRMSLNSQPPAARFSLADTARDVGYSPFHMARVFRAVTGSSVHGYAERLRLRRALDRVADGERDLSALAAELGFASHSHFTQRFRRAFQCPPSALRPGRPDSRVR
jgi:AraC-like DNA-binding protein